MSTMSNSTTTAKHMVERAYASTIHQSAPTPEDRMQLIIDKVNEDMEDLRADIIAASRKKVGIAP